MADMKVLRVCLARDLPVESERLSNYIYFTYDSLAIYFGSNDAMSADFALVDEMPESPVPRMIYIKIPDGTVHQYLDYTDKTIAEIEDESQLEFLTKAGTTYFVNGDSKYIDRQSRALVLPFNNTTYELAVNALVEQQYDNDTIIKYNEEHGRFEIYGGTTDYTEYSHVINGGKTLSVDTQINGARIDAKVILSKALDNALKVVSDGLYVRSDNKVDKEVFEEFSKDFRDFKQYAYSILDNLEAEIAYIESIISEESVTNEIRRQIEIELPGMTEALNAYDSIRRSLDNIESECMSYATNTLGDGIERIDQGLQEASTFNDLDDVSGYTHEINYYERDKEYREQEPIPMETKQIIAAAVAATVGSSAVIVAIEPIA